MIASTDILGLCRWNKQKTAAAAVENIEQNGPVLCGSFD